MEKYNYLEAVKEDIKAYIEENDVKVTAENRDELEQQLNEDLFTDDSVTGNGSGSYTFNTRKSEECLIHNLDLLGDAIEEFGGCFDVLRKGADACDVTIRCYLLPQAIAAVLDEIEEETP